MTETIPTTDLRDGDHIMWAGARTRISAVQHNAARGQVSFEVGRGSQTVLPYRKSDGTARTIPLVYRRPA